jgi:hypothetical protein
MPEGRPDTSGLPATCHDRCGSEVRRVSFQHVGHLGLHARSNLVEAAQQVVSAIVRKCSTGDADNPCSATRGRNPWPRRHILVSWPRGDDDVVVTGLA